MYDHCRGTHAQTSSRHARRFHHHDGVHEHRSRGNELAASPRHPSKTRCYRSAKNRSALNGIILTSTNAAAALELVLPEIAQIGFMADSVRVPIPAVSLAILNATFQSTVDADDSSSVSRDVINQIYSDASTGSQAGDLVYSEDQNVPADLAGMRASVVIEATETHTRTGFVNVDLGSLPGIPPAMVEALPSTVVNVPVTHAKVFGWYDNEYGSYTNFLADLTVHVHSSLES